jgi:hypothetical protein
MHGGKNTDSGTVEALPFGIRLLKGNHVQFAGQDAT